MNFVQPMYRVNNLLGADETKTGTGFIRYVNPTELDKVAKELARLIKSYYAGWDIANPTLWRKLGWEPSSGPLGEFLQNYIQLSRETRESLSERNKEWWINTMESRFGTRRDDLTDYINAMLDMIRAGTMSNVILKPYTYQPTELGEDIGKAVGGVFPKLVIAIAVIAGVMVLSNTIIPQVTTSVGAARARRRKRKT